MALLHYVITLHHNVMIHYFMMLCFIMTSLHYNMMSLHYANTIMPHYDVCNDI